ncbi:RDD family protein [Euhalothece natronophila Z-M001]|uniref:RDD family protein n=1 Tax=Euhalothece natronophila Z-M001 TaxID=522448 RepID=A0A5B8NNL7_9CHRO|nr:RDD family protein [Euhalothece natronophila]QDZ40526.1 RDD family protein [Euhalothece natronophila Z-M001]
MSETTTIMPKESYPYRYPRVPIQRRVYAFLLDFFAVWLVSALVGIPIFQFIAFIVGWWGLRVYAVSRYKGQSLGRWAFDVEIINGRRAKLPNIEDLTKRELVLGATALLGMIGLQYGLPNVLTAMILNAPLFANLIIAIGDEEHQQGFHERFVDTVIVPSRRGYSLDIRIRRWVDEISDRMRQ